MPIYQYRCGQCGHEMEALQKISADPLQDCPQCDMDSLVKQVTAASFQLKGTGWYATDFKNSGKPAASTKDSKDSKSADSSDKSKTEKTKDSPVKQASGK